MELPINCSGEETSLSDQAIFFSVFLELTHGPAQDCHHGNLLKETPEAINECNSLSAASSDREEYISQKTAI